MNKVLIIGKDQVPSELRLNTPEQTSLTLVVLPGVSCDLSMDVLLETSGASLDLAGLFVCRGREDVRIKINVRHNCPGCESHQLFKGIVDAQARASFDGLIYVAPDSQKTKAFQECHSILLSSEAVVQARPQLEIYADDVQCSHGATSGYLNPDERFYMQSRGIPEAQARALQMISFLSGVAQRLPQELQQQIYDTLA